MTQHGKMCTENNTPILGIMALMAKSTIAEKTRAAVVTVH